MYIQVHVHMCGGHKTTPGVISQVPSTFFFMIQGHSLGWYLPNILDWLSSNSQMYSHLHLHSTGVKKHGQICVYTIDGTWVLLPTGNTLYRLLNCLSSWLPISTAFQKPRTRKSLTLTTLEYLVGQVQCHICLHSHLTCSCSVPKWRVIHPGVESDSKMWRAELRNHPRVVQCSGKGLFKFDFEGETLLKKNNKGWVSAGGILSPQHSITMLGARRYGDYSRVPWGMPE